MKLTLDMVQKVFREAKPTFRGFGEAFLVHCPNYHKRGGKYEMEINAEQGWYRCHNCGATGNARERWFRREFNDFHHLYIARKKVSDAHEANQHRPTGVRRGGVMWGNSTTVPAPGAMVPFASLPDGHPAVEYLRERKFDIQEIRSLEDGRALLYCTHGGYPLAEGLGTTGGRIIFPVYKDCEIRGWQARYIERVDKEKGVKSVWDGRGWREFHRDADGIWGDTYVPKYYTCPGMPRYELLYNFDTARLYPSVAVVEGPLDQLAVGPACVATFGKAVSSDQIRLIKNIWSKIFLIRDPEIDTTSKTYRNMIAEMAGLDLHQILIPGNRDPGDTPRTEIWALVAQSEEERVRNTTHQHN